MYEYVTLFHPKLLELYELELTSNDLYQSNPDIEIVNGNEIKIPSLTVSGYKDHNRNVVGFNAGSYMNDYETKRLDHDRDIEFFVDPMDEDETARIIKVANLHNRFEKTQAIPELDCYTYSKVYSEANRVGAKITTTQLNVSNALADFDENIKGFKEAKVPLSRIIMYCTPTYETLIKNAEGIQRTLEITKPNAIDRRFNSIDDIGKIKVIPSELLKTAFDFSDGYAVDPTGKQINYILIDPEAQVSRVKYSYINVFPKGHDSRTADKDIYQNRRYNGTFALDQLLKKGVIINREP